MRPGRSTAALFFAALSGSTVGCRASHVVVTVEDPEGSANGATTLAIGFDDEMLDHERAIAGAEFPLTFALAYHEAVMLTVWVEARDDSALAIARGSTPAALQEDSDITVQLSRACDAGHECSDGVYCNGEESCLQGACVVGAVPCPELGSACVTSRCDETHQLCELTFSEGLDDFDACTIDGCNAAGEIVHIRVRC